MHCNFLLCLFQLIGIGLHQPVLLLLELVLQVDIDLPSHLGLLLLLLCNPDGALVANSSIANFSFLRTSSSFMAHCHSTRLGVKPLPPKNPTLVIRLVLIVLTQSDGSSWTILSSILVVDNWVLC